MEMLLTAGFLLALVCLGACVFSFIMYIYLLVESTSDDVRIISVFSLLKTCVVVALSIVVLCLIFSHATCPNQGGFEIVPHCSSCPRHGAAGSTDPKPEAEPPATPRK